MANYTVPAAVATGDPATSTWANQVSTALGVLASAPMSMSLLKFTPGGNVDTTVTVTPTTWVTLGNVTVPAAATACIIGYSCGGIFDVGTTSNVTLTPKIGSISGTAYRPLTAGGGGRLYHVQFDQLTGLSTGSQSVTFLATWTSGTAIRCDTQTRFTMAFLWYA